VRYLESNSRPSVEYCYTNYAIQTPKLEKSWIFLSYE
jgi:hypothetical protein